MTKAQLIAALADLPDTAEILVRALTVTNRADLYPFDGEDTLATLKEVQIVDADGPDAPAFATIEHTLIYRQADNEYTACNHLNAP